MYLFQSLFISIEFEPFMCDPLDLPIEVYNTLNINKVKRNNTMLFNNK